MDPENQVSNLYGVSMLETAQRSLEANIVLALLHEGGSLNDHALVNAAIGAEVNLFGQAALAAAQAAREAGNSPNTVLATAAAILGPQRAAAAKAATSWFIDRFMAAGLADARDESTDFAEIREDPVIPSVLLSNRPDPKAEAMLVALEARGVRSVFVRYLRSLGGRPSADAVLGAISATLAWGPLSRKRISRETAENLPWWLRLFGTLVGASVDAVRHEPTRFCGIDHADLMGRRSLTEVCCAALLGEQPSPADRFAFQTLVGLLLTNGPGAISAQGAKGAVSADGPETPVRVQLNKAMVGFLTHCGYAHGGNGYEGVSFLLERFGDVDLVDPGVRDCKLDLGAMAGDFARQFALRKAHSRELGATEGLAIPCINHPVFKGKAVNVDPREEFVRNLLAERGDYNVFHDYYGELVKALFSAGATRNVFCVNVDAVIATLLLKMLWGRYRAGTLPRGALETAAFTVFLYGRMLGCAAEIDDHLNRGRNMDTRTRQSACRFVT